MNWRNHHVFMAAADDGGSGGGSGGGAAGAGAGGAAAGAGAGAAGAGGGDGAAAGAGAGSGAGTALSAGAAAGGGQGGGGAAAGGAAGAGGAEPGIPDKFVVKDAAGQIDHAATALKLAREGYLPLEKRLGSGDAPPHSIDGYKVNVPEAFKETVKSEDLAKTPGVQALLKDLHGAGASQKVVDAAISAFMREGQALRAAMPAMDAANCEAELRQGEGWKTDEQYKQQVSTAFTAGKAIFGKDFDGIVKDYGNDPRLIRGLASIGKEMQEDMPASPEAQAQIQENLDQLMASKSYLNANDPQHAATMAKVSALTAKLAGQRPVQGGRTHSFKTA